MSASTTPVSSVAGPETTESPKAAGNQPEVKTVENVEYVALAEFQALQKRIEGQSAVLNRLDDRLKKFGEPKAEPKREATLPEVAKQVEELAARQAAFETEKKSFSAKRLTAELVEQLVSNGVTKAQAEDLADLFKAKHADNFVLENDAWTYSTKDGESATAVPLADWIKTFMGTDKGKTYIQPKKNPVADMTQGSPASKTTYGTAQELAAGKFSTAEIRTGKVKVS